MPELPIALLPTEPRTTDSLSPTTTKEEDEHSRIARYENLMWESTQAVIAVSVTGTVLYVLGNLALIPGPNQATAINFLTGLSTLVIGFYFGRTNHARTGGVKGTAT